jgi:hypothetical protein
LGLFVFLIFYEKQEGQQTGQQIFTLAVKRKAARIMAAITEKTKGGKVVSFKFKAFLGRDETGKQIFRCMTWHPPDGLTIGKARKAAELAANAWEKEIKWNYLQEKENPKKA